MKFFDFKKLSVGRILGQSDSEQNDALKMIGCYEWCRLDDLDTGWINARIVTGSRTSALHVSDIRAYQQSEHQQVEFIVGRGVNTDDPGIVCHAPVFDQWEFKSVDGDREIRWIIQVTLSLGESSWTIPLALTSQKFVRTRMVLGRTALEGMFLVDASKTYLMGKGSS